MRHPHSWTAVVCALAIGACSGDSGDNAHQRVSQDEKDAKPQYMVLAEFVEPDSTLRFFADGLVSPNNRCPVRRVGLNPKMTPVYVNGEPFGFC